MGMDLNQSGAKFINGAGGGTSAGDPLTQKVGIDQAAAGLGAVPVADTAAISALGATTDSSWVGSGIASIVGALKAIALRLGAGATPVDGSGTVTLGGTAQPLFSSAVPTNGYFVQNISDTVMWVSDTGTASAAAGSIQIQSGNMWVTPPGYRPTALVSLFCVTTGKVFTAKRW